MKKVGDKKNFQLGSFVAKKVKKVGLLRSGYAAGLPGGFNARTLALTNPLTSDARSVMLRIPLPEDDGFALALPEKPRGGGRIQTGASNAQPPVTGPTTNHPSLGRGRGGAIHHSSFIIHNS